MLQVIAVLIEVVLAATGCAGGEPPAGGLSQAAAYAATLKSTPNASGVLSGRSGSMREFEAQGDEQHVVPGDRWVGAIVVSEVFPLSCGPAPLPGERHGPAHHHIPQGRSFSTTPRANG